MANIKAETTEVKVKKEHTLEEVRRNAGIEIMLPLMGEDDAAQFDVVTVNGKATQIKKGEPVAVSWDVYEAIVHSERYKGQSILV